MSIVTLAEDSLFAGRYRVVRNIAAGGMGAVYEVLHVETARRRALKVMHPHLEQSDDFRKRFQAEARIAGQVESAYIVDVFDAGVDDATKMPFLVMELLKGEELGKRLRRVGKFGFQESVGYLWQTALALDKTHKANIVHRDLKPDNLFLCEEEEGPSKIKVLDFGIAKLMAEGGTQANVTRAMGTPLYMAPEQFKSKSKVSPATDIYALGMMAYAMLVGASYWAEEQVTEDNPYAFASIVMQGPPEPPSVRALRRGVKLPEAFDEWFGQATSPHPDQRFFKATVAIKGLAQALGVDVPGTGSTTNPEACVGEKTTPGQTTPAQTGPGQTGPRQTGPRQTGSSRIGSGPVAASSSGPQATVMLDPTPSSADPGTHASGYGVSASGPRAGSESSMPLIDTATTNPAQKRTKRHQAVPMMILGVVMVGLVAAVMVMFGTRNRSSGEAKIAPVVAASNHTVEVHESPKVEPVEVATVKGMESVAPPSASFVTATSSVVATSPPLPRTQPSGKWSGKTSGVATPKPATTNNSPIVESRK
jgi:eukaryotic-like serine/threonine-protein kinase